MQAQATDWQTAISYLIAVILYIVTGCSVAFMQYMMDNPGKLWSGWA